MSDPDTVPPTAAVLPCARCGPDVPCAMEDRDPRPCSGQIRGYYTDWDKIVHLCEQHKDAYILENL